MNNYGQTTTTDFANFGTNLGGGVSISAQQTSIQNAGQTRLMGTDASRMIRYTCSRMNHGLILRDKLIIWNERMPANQRFYPINIRGSQVIPVGTRTQLNGASDGDFIR